MNQLWTNIQMGNINNNQNNNNNNILKNRQIFFGIIVQYIKISNDIVIIIVWKKSFIWTIKESKKKLNLLFYFLPYQLNDQNFMIHTHTHNVRSQRNEKNILIKIVNRNNRCIGFYWIMTRIGFVLSNFHCISIW